MSRQALAERLVKAYHRSVQERGAGELMALMHGVPAGFYDELGDSLEAELSASAVMAVDDGYELVQAMLDALDEVGIVELRGAA